MAIENGFSQLGELDKFHVYYNPTHTGLVDTVESGLGKIAGPSNLAKQLSTIFADHASTLRVVAAHSQGSIVVANALNLIPGQLSPQTVFDLYGPAAQ